MGAKAVRDAVATLLEPVTGLRVVGFADDVQPEPSKAVAVVYVTALGPVDVATRYALLYKVAIILAVAKTDPGKSDDALDDLLDLVLAELDNAKTFTWTTAERGTYLGGTTPDGQVVPSFPSYTISGEMRA